MSDLTVSITQANAEPSDNRLKSNAYWFHIFQSMLDHGLAKIGPDAFAIYCVIKSCCDLKTGRSRTSIETIARKSGISERQVTRKIKVLETEGYISISRTRRYNVYLLTEKLLIHDDRGRCLGQARFNYLPAQIKNTVDELKQMLRNQETTGKRIQIEYLEKFRRQSYETIQLNEADLESLAEKSPGLYQALLSIRSSIHKRNEIES